MKSRIIFIVCIAVLMLLGLTSCNYEVVDARTERVPSSVDILLAQIPTSTATREELLTLTPEKLDAEYEEYIKYEKYEKCKGYECPPPARYKIALTFDDGPSSVTEYILDILEKHGARATFCVLGNRVESRADIVRRASELGNEIIGHSWNHQDLSFQNDYNIRRQIVDTSAAIETAIGVPSLQIFRAPYGSANDRVLRIARELGYSILNWTVDPEDWRHRDAYTIYRHVMNHALDGSIVLLHDIFPATAEAMEFVVPRLIEKGFQLVTVSELIEYVYGEIEPGRVYRGLRPGERPRER